MKKNLLATLRLAAMVSLPINYTFAEPITSSSTATIPKDLLEKFGGEIPRPGRKPLLKTKNLIIKEKIPSLYEQVKGYLDERGRIKDEYRIKHRIYFYPEIHQFYLTDFFQLGNKTLIEEYLASKKSIPQEPYLFRELPLYPDMYVLSHSSEEKGLMYIDKNGDGINGNEELVRRNSEETERDSPNLQDSLDKIKIEINY
ncbi:MAG TPA: hypothetical protein VJZ93_03025 [Candidatus Nanoarchaeia archaeon]|nr:hypothetical protein [Candidatus Nanoarchaeia archaeon]